MVEEDEEVDRQFLKCRTVGVDVKVDVMSCEDWHRRSRNPALSRDTITQISPRTLAPTKPLSAIPGQEQRKGAGDDGSTVMQVCCEQSVIMSRLYAMNMLWLVRTS